MSTKSKPPVVKLNLAAKLRQEKANPCIFLKKEIERLKLVNASLMEASVTDGRNTISKTSHLYTKPELIQLKPTVSSRKLLESDKPDKLTRPSSSKDKPIKGSATNFIERNKIALKSVRKTSVQINNQPNNQRTIVGDNPIRKRSYVKKENTINDIKTVKTDIKQEERKANKIISNFKAPAIKSNTIDKQEDKIRVGKPDVKKPVIQRRSLSAVHFKKIKTNDMNSFRTRSTERLNVIPKTINVRTPIREEPEFSQRRSVVTLTPVSTKKRTFASPKITHKTTALELQSRLNNWLEKRGKPIGSFHHLKCFGIHILPALDEYQEEDKENFDGFEHRSDSFENLHINEDQCKADTRDLLKIANDGLHDLHKLITEGYPRESCEAWLQLIKSKFKQLEDQPQYWECRAALEETHGNFSSAIDCYQQAIIKGAEVKNVDESLEQLLKKFQVLNLSPTITKEVIMEDKGKGRRKTITEARNVFKSSIINFAVQERSLKNKDTEEMAYQFFATPVRRSTRLSRSAKYTSTPGYKLCSTLKELDESTRKSMIFKNNKALIS